MGKKGKEVGAQLSSLLFPFEIFIKNKGLVESLSIKLRSYTGSVKRSGVESSQVLSALIDCFR